MRYGAAAGAIGVVLFVVATAVQGERPAFDASGAQVVAHLAEHRTQIQVSCALFALSVPLLVWFFATVASLARAAGPAPGRAGAFAYGCGLIFSALFLADVTTLAVGALRPENMARDLELAIALRDIEFLLMGMAAFMAAAALAAFAVIALREKAVWPEWLGLLAAIAAVAYSLRTGTLFTTTGPFAADGVLGLWVPVIAFAGWTVLASAVLVGRLRAASG